MASLKAVTFDNSTKSAVVDLKGLDIIGFWDKDEVLAGSSFTVTTSDESAGDDESDPLVSYDDATTAITIALEDGVHNYCLVPDLTFAGVQRFVWITSNETEGAATPVTAYLVVRDFR